MDGVVPVPDDGQPVAVLFKRVLLAAIGKGMAENEPAHFAITLMDQREQQAEKITYKLAYLYNPAGNTVEITSLQVGKGNQKRNVTMRRATSYPTGTNCCIKFSRRQSSAANRVGSVRRKQMAVSGAPDSQSQNNQYVFKIYH